MDRFTVSPAGQGPRREQRDTVRGRVRALPPPPGTYAPRLPPRGPAGAGVHATNGAGPPPISPTARRCLQEIIELLDRATALLRQHADGQPPAGAQTPYPTLAGAAATPRLVAVELAVAGHDRSEVRRRLASEFALVDPGRVLDEVFGAGTPGHQRLPGARSVRSQPPA